MLANLLIDVGQTTAARAELEKAVHLHAHDPEAYVRLAELDAADGRVTEAGLLYAKASDLADTFNESPKRRRQVQVRALSGAAAIAENRERWSAARDYLQALARIEPDNAATPAATGQVAVQTGGRAEARRALEAANAADGKSIPADLTLAAFYTQAGDKTNARKCIQSVLEKGADSLSAQIGLARWMLQAGRARPGASSCPESATNRPRQPRCQSNGRRRRTGCGKNWTPPKRCSKRPTCNRR